MAEESPQNINPATDPQVEDPPSTAVPASQVDRAPAEVNPSSNPEVPQPTSDLPPAFVYPGPGTPTQDAVLVAQAPGAPINDASTAVNRGTTSVPISEFGATPINPQPGVTEPRLIIDPSLPNTGTGSGGTTTVTGTALSPRDDPNTVMLDETGTISTIQRNPETGELYNTGEAPRQLPQAQLQREAEAATNTTGSPTPAAPATPPASQTQTAPAPAPNQDYSASSDAANLEAAQRAETDAFNRGQIPAPVIQDSQPSPPPVQEPPASSIDRTPQAVDPQANPQVPAPDGTTSGPGITGPVPGISPYGEQDDPRQAPASGIANQPGPATATDYGSSGDAAALEAAQRAENEAFRQGRFPAPVTGDGQSPQGDGTLDGPGITGQVPGISPYGEEDDRPVVDINRDPVAPDPGPYDYIDNDPVPDEQTNITEPEPVDSPYQDEEEGTLVDFNTGERVTAGQAQASAAIAQSAVNNARNQQSIREQRRNNPDSADWRVRIRLAPNANYLYNADDPGILAPLSSNSGSDGVIFPYTPTVQTVYKANYNSYDLTHSNYRGFFYQSSVVDDIQITGTFTAQDTLEAEYLLAVIHFFRSASKMFYGQDTQRGAPPPLVYLSAFGQFQYVDAPCVISQFNYNLPADVDYIRARSPNQDGTNLLKRRQRQSVPTNVFQAAWNRITTSGLPRGGQVFQPPPPRLGLNGPTYVPTRIDITVVLHPMQTRKQVSQQFSLKEYGAGRLQPKGYW